MDRKDEIIRMQNEIMQGLIRQRMHTIGEDLWGLPGGQGTDKPSPAAPAARTERADAKAPQQETAEQEAPESMDDLKAELHGYIGLSAIKEEVDSLINWIEICKQRKATICLPPICPCIWCFPAIPARAKP